MYRSIHIALSALLITLLCLIGDASPVHAQNAITINASANLSFGTISRSGGSSVIYGSNAAAQFTVIGDTSSNVRLTISTADLTAHSGASSNAANRRITPAITSADCAYSLDGGMVWLPFVTGALYQDTRFPAGIAGTSSILVRIGGSITGGGQQQRGSYVGSITLTAEYR